VTQQYINDENTRVEIFLPYIKAGEKSAAIGVINNIKKSRNPGSKTYRYKGMTHSSTGSPVFTGAWRDTKKSKWVLDRLVILTLDLDISYQDSQKVEQEVSRLKNEVKNCYVQNGAKQQEIWMVAHPIGIVETAPVATP